MWLFPFLFTFKFVKKFLQLTACSCNLIQANNNNNKICVFLQHIALLGKQASKK